jgi:uncharacterized protein (DUF427 family)
MSEPENPGIDRREGVAPNGKIFESVWDYPRPPRLEQVLWPIRVVHGGATIVDSPSAWRVLETSQPPAYYVAAEFVDVDRLAPSTSRHTLCEWKGLADYADVTAPDGSVVVHDAAWTYPDPTPAFALLRRHWAFYAQRVDECWVDGEQVVSNEGNFYGGWITSNVTGPFKGAPGTMHW